MNDTTLLCFWTTKSREESLHFHKLVAAENVAITATASTTLEFKNKGAALLQVPADLDQHNLREKLREASAASSSDLDIVAMAAGGSIPPNRHDGERGLVITLLSQEFDAQGIIEVVVAALAQNLKINDFALVSPPHSAVAVQIKVEGNAPNPEWASDFIANRKNQTFDLLVQKDDRWRTRRRMVCFDMDSTLIKAEVIDELAKRAGVGEQVAKITERAMQGELDFTQSFTERMALLNGLSENVLEAIAAELPLMDGVEVLFHNLRAHGFKTAILSGGFNYFGKVLQEKLGIDYVFANTLEIDGGKLTGRAVEPIVDGQRKADLLLELATKEGFELAEMVAVGDGANDLIMLSKAGMGVAFRAKPLVRQKAEFSISVHGLDGLLYLLGLNSNDFINS